MSEAPELSADEKAAVARFEIHDEPDDDVTVTVFEFRMAHCLSETDLRDALREYRSETGVSPFEWGELDVLDDGFVNWWKWERL